MSTSFTHTAHHQHHSSRVKKYRNRKISVKKTKFFVHSLLLILLSSGVRGYKAFGPLGLLLLGRLLRRRLALFQLGDLLRRDRDGLLLGLLPVLGLALGGLLLLAVVALLGGLLLVGLAVAVGVLLLLLAVLGVAVGVLEKMKCENCGFVAL